MRRRVDVETKTHATSANMGSIPETAITGCDAVEPA